jgi:hypothetical protein
MFSNMSLASAAAALVNYLSPAAANAQARSDTPAPVAGQATSNMPSMGAGSRQEMGPDSEDQGGTGVNGSAQGEGATNKDPAPRD